MPKSIPTTKLKSTKPQIDYRSLFESLPQAYIAFAADDPLFTIIAENEAHAKIANVLGKDNIGKPVFEVFPDVSEKYKKTGVSDLLESFRKVIRTGKPDTMPLLHYDIPREDGEFEERFWRVTHRPVRDETGKVVGVYQITEDITKEMAAANKLERAQQQLDEALSSGLIGTWLWDVKKDIVIGDKNMANMFGVPVDEAAVGLPLGVFTSSVFPEDRDRVQKEIDHVLKTDSLFTSEYRTLRRDGSTRWVIARGRIERDKEGNPVNFPGVLLDITDRKIIENNITFLSKAGEILSASLDYEKTLQSIAKLAVPDIADWCAVEILDENGVPKRVAVAHKDPEKIKWAKELREQQGPPDMQASTGIAKVIRTGEAEYYPDITDEMLVAAAKDKKELKLMREIGFTSAITVPLTVNGANIGAISFVTSEQKRNYTQSDLEMALALANRASIAMNNASLYDAAQKELAERKRLEEELRIANEDLERRVEERTAQLEETNTSLERSNQELQDFAYVASHDLQEPLRKIQAFGNLLEAEYAKQLGEGADYLERMRNAAARMSALIEDILAFSRVTTKARSFTPVNLSVVIAEVLSDLETRIEDTKGVVEVDKLPTIDADAMQIRQLFQNLIANALKFHKPGKPPVVKISATTEISQSTHKKTCTIKIQDNGVGFDEKYLDRIFAVFQRLHSRDSYEGTGIGLAVCRKIVERHGGTITATSQIGKGATFIVQLPTHHKKGEKYDK